MSSCGRCWIITSVANGNYFTFDLFVDYGFEIDECHYTSDSAVVYTYVHFKSLVRSSNFHLFLDRVKREKGILPFEVFGYDSVARSSTNLDLSEHIGFKMLLSHYQSKNPSFISCTDGKPGVTRGIFWRHDAVPRIQTLLNQRSRVLASFFEGMCNELEKSKEKAVMLELIQEQMVDTETKFEHFEFVYHVLEYRISQLDKESQKKLLEPALGRTIFPDSVFFRRLHDDE